MIDNVLVGSKCFVIDFLNYELVYCYCRISICFHILSSCIYVQTRIVRC